MYPLISHLSSLISGKSTALSLIQRFYDPQKGSVLLDGKPLSEYAPDFLAQQFGIVPQAPVLFEMSIKDNMLWGKADATDEEIADALQKAHIWHDIERMPFRTATLATNLR